MPQWVYWKIQGVFLTFFSCHNTYSIYHNTLYCDKDLDECLSNPCHTESECGNYANMYECECPPWRMGKRCETYIGFCNEETCQHDGTCTDEPNGFKCACLPRYKGKNCEIINACISNPCLNKSVCKNVGGTFECTCSKNYHGDLCEKFTDPCVVLEASFEGGCNNGICVYNESFQGCECNEGWRGASCTLTEIEILPPGMAEWAVPLAGSVVVLAGVLGMGLSNVKKAAEKKKASYNRLRK